MICLFAFSSIVGNYYYGEINIGFISKNYMTLMLFRVFVVGMVLFGSVAKVCPGMGSGRSVYGADGDNEFSGDREF